MLWAKCEKEDVDTLSDGFVRSWIQIKKKKDLSIFKGSNVAKHLSDHDQYLVVPADMVLNIIIFVWK